MKTCPKCNGKYFDTDEYCSDCKVELVDNKTYNEVLSELNSMSYEEREKHKYEARYRTAYRYNYNYDNSQSNATSSQSNTVQQANKPKCPTCGGTNIKHISTANRAVSVLALGILSGKIGKNYECLDCKARW